MSIDNTRKFLEKSGCSTIIGVALALVFIIGFANGSCNKSQGPGENSASDEYIKALEKLPVGVTFKDSKVQTDLIYGALEGSALSQEDSMRQQAPQYTDFDGLQPIDRCYLLGREIQNATDLVVLEQIAREKKLDVTPEGILKTFRGLLEESFAQNRKDLIAQGKLKEGATDAEFIEAFKTSSGKTPDEFRAEQQTQLNSALGDRQRRIQLLTFAYRQVIAAEIKKTVKLTEADITKNYSDFSFKVVQFSAKTGGTEAAKKQAEAFLADLSAKKITFEAAMEKYNPGEPPAGKKKSEVTTDLPAALLMGVPEYQPLLNLKAGETSQVVVSSGGCQIYHLVTIKPNLPADYATRKDTYRNSALQQEAERQLLAMTEEAKKQTKPVINDPGIKALNEVFTLVSSPDSQNLDLYTKAHPILVDAQNAFAADGNSIAAAYAQYMLINTVWQKADAAKKSAMADDYIKALDAILKTTENSGARLDLVDALVIKKDKRAGAELVTAAQANSGFGTRALANNQNIFKLSDSLKAAQLITADQLAEIAKTQASWLENKKQFDASMAKQKAEDDRQKKEAEEAQKKAEAERKRAEEEAKKATGGATGTTGGTTGATGTTSGAPKSTDLTTPPTGGGTGGSPSSTDLTNPPKPGGN